MRRSRASKKVLKIGIIGCGTIGSLLAEACEKDLNKEVKLVALYDMDTSKEKALRNKLKMTTAPTPLRDVIKKSDFIIEAASAEVSARIADMAISAGKDVMVMSVGGLLKRQGLIEKAKRNGCKIYLPSGAICGLDGVKAARIGNIRSVTITTRKPPEGLRGAPYIKEKRIDLKSIKKETVIFEGSAAQAVKAFPKNINVSATLSLAGVGDKKTRVKIIVSPQHKKNIHEIELKGNFGRIYTRCENVPSVANPKTSMLAALSAVATLRGITEAVRIGT